MKSGGFSSAPSCSSDCQASHPELLPDVPARFSLPQHPKDDHLFDLAIQAQADYLVTWESRLLKLQSADTPEAQRLRQLAPKLTILTPKQLSDALKISQPPPQGG